MFCVPTGPRRYDGGVERSPGPDGGPPAEFEVQAPRRFERTDPELGDVDEVAVEVYRHDRTTADREPRYVRGRARVDARHG